jgi:hypothetical protein
MIDDDDDCGAVGGMRIGRGNRCTRRIPAPVPVCPPQIPHDLFNGLNGVISQKMVLFITTAVRTSNPTQEILIILL